MAMETFAPTGGHAGHLTWKRVPDGLAVPVAVDTDLASCRADSLAARASMISRLPAPHAIVARRTAAWLWGLDVLPPGVRQWRWDVELVLPGRDLPPDELPAEHIVEEAGVRVTSLARTALDCARWLPRLEAVAALDQFLRRGADPASLAAMARDLAGRPNARRLRDVLRLGDGGAASPGESWTRVMVVDTGFPGPVRRSPSPARTGSRCSSTSVTSSYASVWSTTANATTAAPGPGRTTNAAADGCERSRDGKSSPSPRTCSPGPLPTWGPCSPPSCTVAGRPTTPH
ncbi:hypothetical protein [Actinomadura keratinilytica]|uniref:hypothetical protein n=1 Tax=Actinomadura keratinilytica TaxID=547461 RepID=UPI003609192B